METGTFKIIKILAKIKHFYINFSPQEPKYSLVMLENPQVAKDLIYNYRGMKLKVPEMKLDELSLCSRQIIEKLDQF